VPEPDDSTPAKVRAAATLTGPAQRRGLRLRNRDPRTAASQPSAELPGQCDDDARGADVTQPVASCC
jgi:hypothetical protein